MKQRRIRNFGLGVTVLLAIPALGQVNASLYTAPKSGLEWRMIGPLRGGKSTSVVGVPGNPAIYYMGTAGSGAWRTTDGARTWQNVSDGVRLTGIGAVAVAPSAPSVVYIGASGQGERNGLYRSTDGGETFTLVALDGHAVAAIVIDPHNPRVVMAASSDAGLVRSSNGGVSFATVLAPDAAMAGSSALVFASEDARVVYSAGRARGARGGRVAAATATPDPPIYRSNDEGAHWVATGSSGLPERGRGTVALSVAPGFHGARLYAYMAQGVYRSDDAGGHWRQTTTDPRLIGGGQFHDIQVDPTNANVLYATQTSFYRSTDAGATWESFTGAPSGDDFNYFWIDPTNPLNMALAVDQGTEVSMNGGHTWTTWYNQPTAQLYNVTTDHQFPFFMYSSQQDSGTVAVPIRSNAGEITYRDWYTTNGFETARITPDPLHPNVLYATGWYGSILRVDHTTGQTQHVFERNAAYREAGSPPMEFSPTDQRVLYIGTQYLLRTSDEGRHWTAASPDLTDGNGAISTIAPSAVAAGTIWVGTSSGKVQLTRDNGTSWSDVTPTGLAGAVVEVEAGHSDGNVAYVVVSGRGGRGASVAAGAVEPPPILRTSDGGKTWQPVVGGLPSAAVHGMREDPVKPSLLFAAVDSGVFASFDTGGHWQSLELNLPNASCRDLAIEQNDLVVATYGRGLWALDDIGMLRQLSDNAATDAARLYAPTPTIRLQWDTYTDTPLNPEMPSSENPPDGAILDYYLPAAMTGGLKMEILDSAGQVVRTFSDQGAARLPYKVNVPDYWLAPPSVLPNHAGENRFVWNLRYPDPPYLLYTYFGVHTDYFEYTLADHAIPHNTPWHEPQGPMVLPGQYQVRLTAGGQTLTEPLMVRLDPRLTSVTQHDLGTQLGAAQELVAGLHATVDGYDAVGKAGGDQAKAVMSELGNLDRDQARILIGVTQADAAPGQEMLQTVHELCVRFNTIAVGWNQVKPSGSAGLTELHCESLP